MCLCLKTDMTVRALGKGAGHCFATKKVNGPITIYGPTDRITAIIPIMQAFRHTTDFRNMTGELPEEFAVMKELQKTIGGDAAKGKLLLEHLKELEEEEYIIGITDEVINEFAKSDWVNISEEV